MSIFNSDEEDDKHFFEREITKFLLTDILGYLKVYLRFQSPLDLEGMSDILTSREWKLQVSDVQGSRGLPVITYFFFSS